MHFYKLLNSSSQFIRLAIQGGPKSEATVLIAHIVKMLESNVSQNVLSYLLVSAKKIAEIVV